MQEEQEQQDNSKENYNTFKMINDVFNTEGGQALLNSIAGFIEKRGAAPAVDTTPAVERRFIFEERRMESWRRHRNTHLWTYTAMVAVLLFVLSTLVFYHCISETIYATLVSSLIGYIFGNIKNREKPNDSDK